MFCTPEDQIHQRAASEHVDYAGDNPEPADQIRSDHETGVDQAE